MERSSDKAMARKNMVDMALTIITRVGKVAYAIRQTHSLTYLRLWWLGIRTRGRVPGIFHFPFGPVRYTNAWILQALYFDIFVNRIYDVVGLGDTPIIVDCGGNIGLSVIWFKQRYPAATITVYEADPSIASVLAKNTHALRLQSVEVVGAAVSDRSGTTTFIPDGMLGGQVSDEMGLTVEAVRLSDRIREPVDLLKIDIEGSEFRLVADLCDTGAIKFVRHMVCEIHGRRDVQGEIAKLWTNLSEAGFRITVSQAEVLMDADGVFNCTDPAPSPPAPNGHFVLLIHAWRQ